MRQGVILLRDIGSLLLNFMTVHVGSHVDRGPGGVIVGLEV